MWIYRAESSTNSSQVHADKLANIKPSIDNTPPKAQVHLENRRKRDQQKEGIQLFHLTPLNFFTERLSVIEEHNHILLKKMMTIMKTPSKSIPPANSSPPTRPKTLNTETRKKQLEEINAQNQVTTTIPFRASMYANFK